MENSRKLYTRKLAAAHEAGHLCVALQSVREGGPLVPYGFLFSEAMYPCELRMAPGHPMPKGGAALATLLCSGYAGVVAAGGSEETAFYSAFSDDGENPRNDFSLFRDAGLGGVSEFVCLAKALVPFVSLHPMFAPTVGILANITEAMLNEHRFFPLDNPLFDHFFKLGAGAVA